MKACNGSGCSAASSALSATTNYEITVTELKDAARDVLPYYAYFSISATAAVADYYLTMKEKGQDKPTASEIKTGLFFQRNLSTTPIRTLVWGHIGTTAGTGTAVATEVIVKMLKPSTNYTLYGMPKDGTDADVKALKYFSTDALPTSIPTGASEYGYFLPPRFSPAMRISPTHKN